MVGSFRTSRGTGTHWKGRALLHHGLPHLVGVVALYATGCATIDTRVSRTTETVLSRSFRHDPTDGVIAQMTQSGTRLDVVLTAACRKTETMRVDEVATHERYNFEPWKDWVLGGIGIAGLAGGVVVLADSGNVGEDSRTANPYNRVGRDKAVGLGIGVAAVGAGALAVAIVDIVRANGQEDFHELRDRDGQVLSERESCEARIPRPAELTERVGTADVARKTYFVDKEVKVTSNLEELVPLKLSTGKEAPPQEMAVLVNDTDVGSVDLGPLHLARAASAWEKADPPGCREPKATTACDAVKAFSETFAWSPLGTTAKGILAAAAPALDALADEEAWTAAGASNCAKPTEETDCDGLREYLDARPHGGHAAEAQKTLTRSERTIAALVKKREGQERREAQQRARESRSGAASSGSSVSYSSQCRVRCVLDGLACAHQCADYDDGCGMVCRINTESCQRMCP